MHWPIRKERTCCRSEDPHQKCCSIEDKFLHGRNSSHAFPTSDGPVSRRRRHASPCSCPTGARSSSCTARRIVLSDVAGIHRRGASGGTVKNLSGLWDLS